MPAGDRTGPWGLGPRTGRGLGYCSGYRAPGFMIPGPGLGFGRGFGFRRGFGRGMGLGRGFWRPGFVAPYDPWGAAELTPEQELDFLKAEAQQVRDELTAIEERIQELERKEK